MLGLNQEGQANFNASRQLILLSSLYGYKGQRTEIKEGLYSVNVKGFRDMMESNEPINPELKMSVEEERRLLSQGNSKFLIDTLKRAGELGLLARDGHQNSRVVQHVRDRLKQQSGLKTYNNLI